MSAQSIVINKNYERHVVINQMANDNVDTFKEYALSKLGLSKVKTSLENFQLYKEEKSDEFNEQEKEENKEIQQVINNDHQYFVEEKKRIEYKKNESIDENENISRCFNEFIDGNANISQCFNNTFENYSKKSENISSKNINLDIYCKHKSTYKYKKLYKWIDIHENNFQQKKIDLGNENNLVLSKEIKHSNEFYNNNYREQNMIYYNSIENIEFNKRTNENYFKYNNIHKQYTPSDEHNYDKNINDDNIFQTINEQMENLHRNTTNNINKARNITENIYKRNNNIQNQNKGMSLNEMKNFEIEKYKKTYGNYKKINCQKIKIDTTDSKEINSGCKITNCNYSEIAIDGTFNNDNRKDVDVVNENIVNNIKETDNGNKIATNIINFNGNNIGKSEQTIKYIHEAIKEDDEFSSEEIDNTDEDVDYDPFGDDPSDDSDYNVKYQNRNRKVKTFKNKINKNKYEEKNKNNTQIKLNRTESPEGTIYYCTPCNRRYYTKTGFSQHKRFECNKPPAFQCLICYKEFNRKSSLKRHLRQIHETNLQMNINCIVHFDKLSINSCHFIRRPTIPCQLNTKCYSPQSDASEYIQYRSCQSENKQCITNSSSSSSSLTDDEYNVIGKIKNNFQNKSICKNNL